MPVNDLAASLTGSWPVMASLLCVAARVGSAFVFVPMPGFRSAPAMVKAALVAAFTVASFPLLDAAFVPPASIGGFLALLATEVMIGAGAGAVIGMLNEIFSFAMQSLAMQAGYAYASAIDPNTQADSGVLMVIAQLAAHLLFFTTGVYLWVFRAFATSLERVPPGQLLAGPADAARVIAFGGAMLEFGVRLALPVMGLLLLTDITLALLGRIQPSLQLLTLIFPVKMLGTLFLLAALTPIFPKIYRAAAERALPALAALLR
jgi:flagellar biosynthesis protein FliR